MKYFDGSIYSNPGDPIHIIYDPVVMDDGTVELVESGKENTDEIIRSYKDSCDMSVILEKYMNGDTSVIQKRAAMYGDFTNMPKTYAEVLQMEIDAKNAFDRLPVEIKEKFDNDINKFLVSSGTEEWFDKLGMLEKKEEVVEKVESEVKE